MKQTTQVIAALENEAKRIEEDATYTGKSHLNAAAIWNHRHYWLGIPATLAGALAGAAIVKDAQIMAGILSLIATILTGLVTFLKPYEHASQHKTIGDQFLALRNDTRVFREIDIPQTQDVTLLTEALKSFSARRNDLMQSSPDVPRKAFEQARLGIGVWGAMEQPTDLRMLLPA
jgi:hypothetical protein